MKSKFKNKEIIKIYESLNNAFNDNKYFSAKINFYISKNKNIFASLVDEIEEEMTTNQFLRETKEKPAGDEVASYNKALKIAKENNKPVIYGYTNNRLAGKFFGLDTPIICDNVSVCEKNFRNKYKNCSTVYIVYPDKEFVET